MAKANKRFPKSPPTITNLAAFSISENSSLAVTLTANQVVTWTKTGGADAAFFTLAGSTLTLPAKNFDSPQDSGGNNTYQVQVTATNQAGRETSQTITFSITGVNEFTPVITSNGGLALASISVAENQTAVTTVQATDADAEAVLTYSIIGGVDANNFSIDSSTGILRFVQAPDFETPADADLNNQYIVQVQVSDGVLTDTQTITVTVTDVVESGNSAPVITSNGGGSTASISIAENTTAVTTVVATDADLDTLTYSIIGGADQAKFTINSSTGALAFATGPNFESPTDADSNNQYIVQVQVSDGTATDTQTITITITDAVEGAGSVTFNTRTVNNASASALPATAFWTAGWPVKQGDVPSGNILTATLGGTSVPCQAMAIRTHGDGSLAWSQLLFDFSGITMATDTSQDLVITSAGGSWSTTSSRSDADWTALLDTVELTSLTTTGVSSDTMDKAGTWTATFDGGGTNTIEVYGATSVGLWVSVYANFVNTGTTHRYLRARMEYLVCEKGDTSLGPIASRGPFIDNMRAFITNGTDAPSEFDYTINWKRNGASQRSQAGVKHMGMTLAQFCRPDGQWDWTANEPVIWVGQDYRDSRKTLQHLPFSDEFATPGFYTRTAEWSCTCNTTTGLFTVAANLSNKLFDDINPVVVACDFYFTAGGALWTGGVTGQAYWAKFASGTTFTLYDTLAHALAGGSTGQQATGGGSVTNTIVRNAIAPMTPHNLNISQAPGDRPSLGMITEVQAGYHVFNTQAGQRHARTQAYAFATASFQVLDDATNFIPSLLSTGTVGGIAQTPGGMTSKADSHWTGSVGTGSFSTDIGGGAGPTGSNLGLFTDNFRSDHFPSPVYTTWLMEGGTILRDLLYMSGNRAIASINYFGIRNISINGGSIRYATVALDGDDGVRTAAWGFRDVIHARLACADGTTMKTYWDRVIQSNCAAYVEYSDYKGTNFKNLGAWFYDENDYPPNTSRGIGASINDFMLGYWSIVVGFAANTLGDDPTNGTNLTLMRTRAGNFLNAAFGTGCFYFTSDHYQTSSTSMKGDASPGTYAASYADTLHMNSGSGAATWDYATNGTITPHYSSTIEWVPVAGDKWFTTNYHLSTLLNNPPAELTPGTAYTIKSVTGDTSGFTFTLDNGSGGTQTYASGVIGSGGWFIPVIASHGCPPGISTDSSPTGTCGTLLNGLYVLNTGDSATYGAATTRGAGSWALYGGSYAAGARWGLQGTV